MHHIKHILNCLDSACVEKRRFKHKNLDDSKTKNPHWIVRRVRPVEEFKESFYACENVDISRLKKECVLYKNGPVLDFLCEIEPGILPTIDTIFVLHSSAKIHALKFLSKILQTGYLIYILMSQILRDFYREEIPIGANYIVQFLNINKIDLAGASYSLGRKMKNYSFSFLILYIDLYKSLCDILEGVEVCPVFKSTICFLVQINAIRKQIKFGYHYNPGVCFTPWHLCPKSFEFSKDYMCLCNPKRPQFVCINGIPGPSVSYA